MIPLNFGSNSAVQVLSLNREGEPAMAPRRNWGDPMPKYRLRESIMVVSRDAEEHLKVRGSGFCRVL